MRIILCGGGTIGSVSPLIAIREEIIAQKLNAEFIWIGSEDGLEKEIIEKEKIAYLGVKSGKLRRYFTLENFIDPFRVIGGIFQSIKIILRFKPDLILSAGSFVSVPVVIAAWLLRKKTFIHQQDIKPGLANKIMAPFAAKITVTFEQSLKFFSVAKSVITGNPVRVKILSGDKDEAIQKLGMEKDLPTLLVMGGSLGAEKINQLVFDSATELIKFCQIIHIVGKGNLVLWQDKNQFGPTASRYHSYEYLFDEITHAYAAADLVVCRAGLSTLTEMCALRKPIILIPIPDNQQEENAQYFDSKNAALVLVQSETDAFKFIDLVKNLFDNRNSLTRLANNISLVMPAAANQAYVKLIRQELGE